MKRELISKSKIAVMAKAIEIRTYSDESVEIEMFERYTPSKMIRFETSPIGLMQSLTEASERARINLKTLRQFGSHEDNKNPLFPIFK